MLARLDETRGAGAHATRTLYVVGASSDIEGRLRLGVETNWPGTKFASFATDTIARQHLASGVVDVIGVRLEPPFGRALATVRRLRDAAPSTPILGIVERAEQTLVEVGTRSGVTAWVEDTMIGTNALELALGTILAPAPLPSCAGVKLTCATLLALDEGELRRLEELARADADRADTATIEDARLDETLHEEERSVPAGESSTHAAMDRACEGGLISPASPGPRLAEEPSASDTQAPASDERAPSLELALARARKLVLIPIGSDGLPDRDGIARVRSLDVADGILRMTLTRWTTLAGGHAIAAAEIGDARNEFAWIEHDLRASAERGSFVARVRGSLEDLLDASRLEPVLDTLTMRFRYGHSDALIDAWCSIGVLAPVLVDRVVVCPRCEALPTVRLGCRRCGSARLSSERLIHHFACANVARESEYDRPDGLSCAKCRARELVVNADYEYLSGPWDCADCGFQCGERDPVCHCIACGERFFSRDANELELVTFHAARMEPLALLAAP